MKLRNNGLIVGILFGLVTVTVPVAGQTKNKPAIDASKLTSEHLRKINQGCRSGGIDPQAKKMYSKLFIDEGGNYDKIAEKLGVEWKAGGMRPKTADQFATCFLQGKLTKK